MPPDELLQAYDDYVAGLQVVAVGGMVLPGMDSMELAPAEWLDDNHPDIDDDQYNGFTGLVLGRVEKAMKAERRNRTAYK